MLYPCSVRVVQNFITGEFEFQPLLLGANCLIRSGTVGRISPLSGCDTIGLASLSVLPRNETHQSSALVSSSVNCSLQGLLTHSSLEHKNWGSSRFGPTRLQSEALCRCGPHSHSLSPSRFATHSSLLAVATLTVECEDDVTSPLLFSWQHLWLLINLPPCRDRTAARNIRSSPLLPHPIPPPRTRAMNALSPLLKPWIFWLNWYATTGARACLVATCAVTVHLRRQRLYPWLERESLNTSRSAQPVTADPLQPLPSSHHGHLHLSSCLSHWLHQMRKVLRQER